MGQTPGEGTLHSSVGKCPSLDSDSFSGSAERRELCLPGSPGAGTPLWGSYLPGFSQDQGDAAGASACLPAPPRCQASQLPETSPHGMWALRAGGLSEQWTLPFCPAEPRLAPPQAQLVLCCPVACRFLSPEGPVQTPPRPGSCAEVPWPCGPLEWEMPWPQVSHRLVSRAWSPCVGFYCPLVAESEWPATGGGGERVTGSGCSGAARVHRVHHVTTHMVGHCHLGHPVARRQLLSLLSLRAVR